MYYDVHHNEIFMALTVLPLVHGCESSRKNKQSQSSSDTTCRTVGADSENHLDVSLEEEEVSDLSPKKSVETCDHSKLRDESVICMIERRWHFFVNDSLYVNCLSVVVFNFASVCT